jgi:hypothetical protein
MTTDTAQHVHTDHHEEGGNLWGGGKESHLKPVMVNS